MKSTTFFPKLALIATVLVLPASADPIETSIDYAKYAFDAALSILNLPGTAATLAHEVGHAVTAKALVNNPMHIHIGKADVYEIHPRDLRKRFLTFHGFKLTQGFTEMHRRLTARQQLAVTAAGPLAGIASLVAMGYALSKYAAHIPLTLGVYLHRVILLNIIFQSMYGFTPLYSRINGQYTGDGFRFCRLIGVPHNYCIKLANFDPEQFLPKFVCTWWMLRR